MSTKICQECGVDQPVENYYLQNGFRRFKKCKECVKKAKRVVHTPKGFALLAPEIQVEIRNALQDRRRKIIDIAEEHGIKYPTMCYWIRIGSCV